MLILQCGELPLSCLCTSTKHTSAKSFSHLSPLLHWWKQRLQCCALWDYTLVWSGRRPDCDTEESSFLFQDRFLLPWLQFFFFSFIFFSCFPAPTNSNMPRHQVGRMVLFVSRCPAVWLLFLWNDLWWFNQMHIQGLKMNHLNLKTHSLKLRKEGMYRQATNTKKGEKREKL